MFSVSNIKYDTDGYTDLNLPVSMDVPVESEEEIADYISDETGWLVESFTIEK